jgi:hypothetical protein
VNALRKILLPEERVLLGIVVAVAIMLFSQGTELDLVRTIQGYDGLFLKNLCLLVLVTRLRQVYRRWKDPSVGNVSLAHDLTLLRVTGHLFLWISTYTNIKVRIPLLNDAIHDDTLRNLEASVLGFDLPIVARRVQHWPTIADALDRVYHHDYIFLTVSVLLLLDQDLKGVRRLVTAMGLLYIVGVCITALWPTQGPCFVERDAYQWMKTQGIPSWKSQGWLWTNYSDAARLAVEGKTHKVYAFTGVAALPSLHVGHCLMLCAAAWTYHRKALWVYVPITIITWWATLVFGWHYLSDGLASMVLVPICWALAGKIVTNEAAVAQPAADPRASAAS